MKCERLSLKWLGNEAIESKIFYYEQGSGTKQEETVISNQSQIQEPILISVNNCQGLSKGLLL